MLLRCAIALLSGAIATGAWAQKPGGVLRLYVGDSPPSASILDGPNPVGQRTIAPVFNNLVMFDPNVKQNSLSSIVLDLATAWSWNEEGTAVTFPLRQGIRWHDGKPFTAKDVKCTWDLLLEKGTDRLRGNPLKYWYYNLEEVTTNGDYEVTFHLKRPQPAFLMFLADGFSVIYPCHLPAAQMRQHPIGTGPFKFVEFKPNEHIKLTKNPDYWKPGLPHLDGIEFTIIKNTSTATLAFVSGRLDLTFPSSLSVPVMRDVQSQAPQAVCEMAPFGGVNTHLLVNRAKPPFDNIELRRAMALSLDRKAFIDILSEGQGGIGGVLQPQPYGLWGMPPEMLQQLPGYSPDVQKNRAEARRIMEKLGYGPGNRLPIKVTTRDLPTYRDPAVLLIDQLKEIYIDGELEVIDGTVYFPKILRKDYVVSLNNQTSGPDPDRVFGLFYQCGANANWDGYCNAEVDKLIEQQSIESDEGKRKGLVWTIENMLAEDGARPIIFYSRQGTCWHPYVKGLTIMVNSLFNGNRMEDVWLDR